jgi:CHASE2 domain-containing sensor protein
MLVLVVPLLIAFTGLTGRLEPLIHDPLLRAFHGPLPADNTAIVAFPPQRDARALRAQHPAVIDALVEAGARTIFFDVTMTAKTPHDEEIASAIHQAKAAGVAVVLPVVMEGGQVMLPESEALRDAAWFGPVLAQADTSLWHVRRAPVRVRTLSDGDYWHAAVQSVRGHLSIPESPRVVDGTLIVGATRNPVWADLIYLHPADPSPILEYSKPDSWESVRGRTVLIGEMGGSDDIHLTDAETVYGVEIEAALIETMLQQRAPKVASPEANTLLSLLVGILTAALALALPRRKWPIALVIPVSAVGVAVALVVAGVLVALLPMALAAVVGLWVGRTRVVTSDKTHP